MAVLMRTVPGGGFGVVFGPPVRPSPLDDGLPIRSDVSAAIVEARPSQMRSHYMHTVLEGVKIWFQNRRSKYKKLMKSSHGGIGQQQMPQTPESANGDEDDEADESMEGIPPAPQTPQDGNGGGSRPPLGSPPQTADQLGGLVGQPSSGVGNGVPQDPPPTSAVGGIQQLLGGAAPFGLPPSVSMQSAIDLHAMSSGGVPSSWTGGVSLPLVGQHQQHPGFDKMYGPTDAMDVKPTLHYADYSYGMPPQMSQGGNYMAVYNQY
uniref:Homeobox domain-containing protein n=1 Tax=Plectus sambesii TaxID=2011161 RepID=A0A914V3V0_9BILA